MKPYTKIFFFVFHFSLFLSLSAQVNYEPVNKSIYGFLERMSIKGAIQLNEEIRPFSRLYIAKKIIEIEKKKTRLTNLEKEDLDFYIKDFASELKKLGFDLTEYEAKKKIISLNSDNFGFDKYNRLRILSYDTDEFSLFADPVFRLNYVNEENNISTLWSNGLRMYGSIGDNVGFELQFYDNHADGNYYSSDRKFSKLTGYEFNVEKHGGLDFDRMNANLSYSWEWGNITLGKDFNYYGSGENGQIILSSKAPSFPYIKLEANPTKWFKFSYIQGSLNSQIIDSSGIRVGFSRDHYPKVSKYFVAHMFSFTPFKYLNISLGESVIYSDRFEPIYLIPVAFFRLADHYLTDPDESAGNAQLFGSFWLKSYKLRTKLYGSIFIDELSLGNSENPQAIAYNLGFKSIDPLIRESEFILEYSKILPFVYFHVDKAQTYENYGYQLGHWIGSNGDQIYVSFIKKVIRGLNISFSYTYTRKGEEEKFNETRYQKKHKFLWGKNYNISEYIVKLNYEILNDIFFDVGYSFYRTTLFNLQKNTTNYSVIIFSIGYGFM